ncbi:MAG: nucleotidyl transferase AbiEii/AbiGii toxin family protein [Deltaproteobacteria bacterium]|nr:nucleotidyl transferase AbiEii/AbiGii toxin family protein [Deltaproteobacteria bacterium]
MNKPKKYLTSSSFRQALDDHLRNIAKKEGLEISRLKHQIAFDRFLFRLFHEEPSPWLLKGGYAIELRLHNAPATKDIDLALKERIWLSENTKEQNEALHEKLQTCLIGETHDFFDFTIGSASMTLVGPPEKGARFPVEAHMDGRSFSKFNLDVSVGDPIIQPEEKLKPRNYLSFAGIESKAYPTISIEQQFSEKLHAYTRPRTSGHNSRVKDLMDMVLLIESKSIDPLKIVTAIEVTFKQYQSHDCPKKLSEPPSSWKDPFQVMAKDCGFDGDLIRAFQILSDFFDSLSF